MQRSRLIKGDSELIHIYNVLGGAKPVVFTYNDMGLEWNALVFTTVPPVISSEAFVASQVSVRKFASVELALREGSKLGQVQRLNLLERGK